MNYLVSFLRMLMFCFILLMPAWISWIPKTSWPLFPKRLIIGMMIIISTLFGLAVIIKKTTNQSIGVLTNILVIIYLLFVFVYAYRNWPR